MAKEKVKFIVSPMYFISEEMVKVYNTSIDDGFEVHFIMTEDDFPFISSQDRLYRLGVTLGNQMLNVTSISSAKEDVFMANLLREIESVNHFEYGDKLDFNKDDVGVELFIADEFNVTKDFVDTGLCICIHTDLYLISDLVKDFPKIEPKLSPRFKSLFGKALAKELSGPSNNGKDQAALSYSMLPYFTHTPEKGKPFRVVLLAKDYTDSSVGLIPVQSATSVKLTRVGIEALVALVNSNVNGEPFVETLTQSGSSSLVVIQEINPSTYLEELAVGRRFIPAGEGVDIVAIPEGRLFDLGPIGAWVAMALDNPSEEGAV